MADRIDHVAEACRALEAGRESAAKAKTAAQAGYAAEADAHGKKAHGCWMQAQAEATLALVEQQRTANLIAYLERAEDLPPGSRLNESAQEAFDALYRQVREGIGL